MQIVRIGDGSSKRHSADVVGAKAANLSHMAALGLPVPPAFVLPVNLCAAIVRGDNHAKQQLAVGLREGIKFLEGVTGKLFGDRRRPLLVSVRSGAARSMPGMLDTVLDVGCTLEAVHGLVRMTGHPRFAWDCRRRFIESYAHVVLGVDMAEFTGRRGELVAAEGAAGAQALDSEATERLARSYQELVDDDDFTLPEDPMEQLESAAKAVYRSWMSDRATTYRRLEHLDGLAGTAATVQAMVFGNRGLTSGAGVAFSRDPSTGAAQPIIDVLFESQGEDVVSGSRSPETEAAIAHSLPAVATQLRATLARLEHEFADVQDIEFTIEDGKLWMLQTRSAKRTPQAALRFAIDFVKEGLLTPAQALRRLNGSRFGQARPPAAHRCACADRARDTRVGRDRGRSHSFQFGGRRTDGGRRRSRDPGAARYQHCRCRRLCGLGGNRDGHRRPHRACRAGGAPDGQALHRRMRGAQCRCRSPRRASCRDGAQRGGLALDRRRDGSDLSRPLRCRRRAAGRRTGGNRALAQQVARPRLIDAMQGPDFLTNPRLTTP